MTIKEICFDHRNYTNYINYINHILHIDRKKCNICDEEINIFSDKYAKCDSQHLYCKPCINAYITSELGKNKCDLRCMNHINGCKRVFYNDYIRDLLEKDVLKRFNEFIKIQDIKNKAQKNSNYQICPNCSLYLCLTSKFYSYYTCGECSFCWCKDCKSAYHSPDPCGTVYANEDEIRNVIREIMTENLTHKCPGCNIKYVKESGCDHITCPSCKAESCYHCRKPYIGHVKQCRCKMYNDDNMLFTYNIDKKTKDKCLKIISLNKDKKVRSIMIDEMEQRGLYVHFYLTKNIFKNIKHYLYNHLF